MKFTMKIYKYQMEKGSRFIHEHPLTATSWQLKEVQDIMDDDRVYAVRTDQCMLGQTSWKRNGEEAPAMKPRPS